MGEFRLRKQLQAQLLRTWGQRTQSPQWLDAYAASCSAVGTVAADYRFVSGHIDAANLPSQRTALRCGRIDAGGWVFLS